MVSNKTLKDYKFSSIYDYFQHIVDSKNNGANKQVRKLIKALSKEQVLKFSHWLADTFCAAEQVVLKNLIIELFCE